MSGMSLWPQALGRNEEILEARDNNADNWVEAETALLDFTGKAAHTEAQQCQLLHQ